MNREIPVDVLLRQLVCDISEVGVKHGLLKLVFHGNCETSLAGIDMLMCVQNLSHFYDKAFCEITGTAFRSGLYGSIIARDITDLGDGFNSMQDWYNSTARIRKVEMQNGELVFIT